MPHRRGFRVQGLGFRVLGFAAMCHIIAVGFRHIAHGVGDVPALTMLVPEVKQRADGPAIVGYVPLCVHHE